MSPVGLVAARAALGLSQRVLAERLGVKRASVSLWELGKTKVVPAAVGVELAGLFAAADRFTSEVVTAVEVQVKARQRGPARIATFDTDEALWAADRVAAASLVPAVVFRVAAARAVYGLAVDRGWAVEVEGGLRCRREALGLTQVEMAAWLGVAQNVLSGWELGVRRPRDPGRVEARVAELEDYEAGVETLLAAGSAGGRAPVVAYRSEVAWYGVDRVAAGLSVPVVVQQVAAAWVGVKWAARVGLGLVEAA